MIKKVWEHIAYWWATAIFGICVVALATLLGILIYQGVVNDNREKKNALEIERETLTLEIYATMRQYELDCTDHTRLIRAMIAACEDEQFSDALLRKGGTK